MPHSDMQRIANDVSAGRVSGTSRFSWAARALAWAAWAMVFALLAQVFTAGVAVFANPAWWQHHRTFIHAFEWLAPLTVVLALVAKAPRGVVALAGATVVLLAVQYTTAHLRLKAGAQMVAAVHPVSGFLLLWAAGELARRCTRREGWRAK